MAESTHPSPQRHKISRSAALISLAGAFLAWVLLMSGSYIISSHACYPHRTPLEVPLWHNIHFLLAILTMVCLLLGIAATLVAYKSWRLTRNEKKGGKHHTLDVGEGRSRFLAMIGLLASSLFVLAIIFTSCAIFLVSACKPWF